MKTKITTLLLFAVICFSTAQTQGTLTVSTLTSATSGAVYSPDNIVAIWVEKNTGTFVKSLLVYANARQQYLYTWIAADPSLNKVDAVTGATQPSYGTIMCSWNGKDVNELVVADGTYNVKMELTDKHAQGNLGTFSFVKGASSQTLTPPAVSSFANVSIKWTPTVTGLEDVAFSNLYEVYPNPTTSSIFVNGSDINEVLVCSVAGKRILSSKVQNIDLSALPKGLYLVIVKAKSGTVVKKIEKK